MVMTVQRPLALTYGAAELLAAAANRQRALEEVRRLIAEQSEPFPGSLDELFPLEAA
jgi:hypothetical protein